MAHSLDIYLKKSLNTYKLAQMIYFSIAIKLNQ